MHSTNDSWRSQIAAAIYRLELIIRSRCLTLQHLNESVKKSTPQNVNEFAILSTYLQIPCKVTWEGRKPHLFACKSENAPEGKLLKQKLLETGRFRLVLMLALYTNLTHSVFKGKLRVKTPNTKLTVNMTPLSLREVNFILHSTDHFQLARHSSASHSLTTEGKTLKDTKPTFTPARLGTQSFFYPVTLNTPKTKHSLWKYMSERPIIILPQVMVHLKTRLRSKVVVRVARKWRIGVHGAREQ